MLEESFPHFLFLSDAIMVKARNGKFTQILKENIFFLITIKLLSVKTYVAFSLRELAESASRSWQEL